MTDRVNTTRRSHYVDADFYRTLVEQFSGWQSDESEVGDTGLRDRCRRLLEREARYLEENRHEDWLSLYADECLYWVPATPGGGNPAKEVAVAFDDRRRLEDRIFRLRTGQAWSQVPPSRTSRIVSNVTVYRTVVPEIVMVRSSFLTTELQEQTYRTWAGWNAHRIELNSRGAGPIRVKQVNLISCDRNLHNPSITF